MPPVGIALLITRYTLPGPEEEREPKDRDICGFCRATAKEIQGLHG